jgi:hypothetical protein
MLLKGLFQIAGGNKMLANTSVRTADSRLRFFLLKIVQRLKKLE